MVQAAEGPQPERKDASSEADLFKRIETILESKVADLAAVEDALVYAAVLGSTIATRFIDLLDAAKDRAIARAAATFEADIADLRRRIDDATLRLARSAPERARLEELHQASQRRVVELHVALSDHRSRLAQVWESLQAARASYSTRWFAHRIRELADLEAGLVEYRVELEQRLLKSETELLKIATQRRLANQAEYDRRAKVLEDRRALVERRFLECDNLVSTLRRVGVTRHMAGYLVWAGYIGFAAFGWYLGTGLESVYGGVLGDQLDFLKAVASAMFEFTEANGLLVGFAVALGIPLVLVFLAAVTLRIARFLERARGQQKGRQKRDGGRGEGRRGTPLIEAKDFKPSLPWNWRVPKDIRPEWLFKLYIFTAVPLTAMTLFGSTSALAVGDAATRAWASLLFSYFGVACAIAVGGLCYAYVTRIAEARSRALLSGNPSPRDIVRAHMEIVLILALIPIGMALNGIEVLTSDRRATLWQPSATIAALYFIIVNGMVVAYGLAYRGLFKDYDALKRECQELFNLAEKYRRWPALYLADAEGSLYEAALEHLDERIADLWEGIDAEWRVDVPGAPARREMFHVDVVLEPELAAEIRRHGRSVEEFERALLLEQSESSGLLARMVALGVAELEARLDAMSGEMRLQNQHYSDQVDSINKAFDFVKLRWTNAYMTGVKLREAANN